MRKLIPALAAAALIAGAVPAFADGQYAEGPSAVATWSGSRTPLASASGSNRSAGERQYLAGQTIQGNVDPAFAVSMANVLRPTDFSPQGR